MKKNILQELPDLIKANVITEETAQKITNYYESKPSTSSNRLFIVFGILGALLVGMGIILIIAHNWDDLNKVVKLAFALLPLFIGQGFCAYTLQKKNDSVAWKESSSVFLMLAIASSISIVSQVYNIAGNLSNFIFVWMFLTLPILYIMRSSIASLMFLIGITWYACEVSYFHFMQRSEIAWWYWALFLSAVPYYYTLFKREPNSNFFHFHSWMIVISLTITLGMFNDSPEELVLIEYMNLFACFVLLGQLRVFQTNKLISNAFLIVGSIGTVILLLSLSFDFYWEEVTHSLLDQWQNSSTFYASLITGVVALLLLFINWKEKSLTAINFKSFAFIAAMVLYFVGIGMPMLSQWLINLLILAMGVFTIRDGAMANRLGVLNYGLLILTALITCRFFDTDMSFVVRGILFIAVGAGFFFANYWMIRKRNEEIVKKIR